MGIYAIRRAGAVIKETMHRLVSSLLTLAAAKFADAANGPSQLNTLVTFGDSYTDVVNTAVNATAWPVYAASYAHATLLPFAQSGGACTNTLTPRPFPSVMENQIPSYTQDIGTKGIQVDYATALYTLWIGEYLLETLSSVY